MPYTDLRGFISTLDKSKELARIKTEVDWKYELGGVVRKSFDMGGPALLFENVKDYSTSVFVGGVQTYPRLAMALDLPPETGLQELINVFRQRIRKPVEPRVVATGPCKENIMKGDSVDLFHFPVPWWQKHDGGRYMGTWHGTVTRDPETGWLNYGMYRMMIHDKKNLGILLAYDQHIGIHYSKYKKLNKPMPAAVIMGMDPVIPISSCTPFAAGVNEYHMAGALRQAPVELVKCETVDLEVPATAEIVVEGEISLTERRMEGTFGEWMGHYGGRPRPRPVMNVKCITFRNNPIYCGTLEGKPVNEDHVVTSVSLSALTHNMLDHMGFQGIRGVHFPAWGGGWAMAVVSVKQAYQAHSRQVAHAVLGSKMANFTKNVIIVDDDIDPFNLGEIWWALMSRLQASRGVTIMPRGKAAILDPSSPRDMRGFADTFLIEAVKPYEWLPNPDWNNERYPLVAYPAPETMELVEKRWKEYGISLKR